MSCPFSSFDGVKFRSKQNKIHLNIEFLAKYCAKIWNNKKTTKDKVKNKKQKNQTKNGKTE